MALEFDTEKLAGINEGLLDYGNTNTATGGAEAIGTFLRDKFQYQLGDGLGLIGSWAAATGREGKLAEFGHKWKMKKMTNKLLTDPNLDVKEFNKIKSDYSDFISRSKVDNNNEGNTEFRNDNMFSVLMPDELLSTIDFIDEGSAGKTKNADMRIKLPGEVGFVSINNEYTNDMGQVSKNINIFNDKLQNLSVDELKGLGYSDEQADFLSKTTSLYSDRVTDGVSPEKSQGEYLKKTLGHMIASYWQMDDKNPLKAKYKHTISQILDSGKYSEMIKDAGAFNLDHKMLEEFVPLGSIEDKQTFWGEGGMLDEWRKGQQAKRAKRRALRGIDAQGYDFSNYTPDQITNMSAEEVNQIKYDQQPENFPEYSNIENFNTFLGHDDSALSMQELGKDKEYTLDYADIFDENSSYNPYDDFDYLQQGGTPYGFDSQSRVSKKASIFEKKGASVQFTDDFTKLYYAVQHGFLDINGIKNSNLRKFIKELQSDDKAYSYNYSNTALGGKEEGKIFKQGEADDTAPYMSINDNLNYLDYNDPTDKAWEDDNLLALLKQF